MQADPDYALLTQAYTYMSSRLLTDPEPRLRKSLEEVLFKNGRLRWNRFETLVTEGRKSQSFDPGQMWLLADWVAAPASQRIRDQLAKELSSMLDAVVAGTHPTLLNAFTRGPFCRFNSEFTAIETQWELCRSFGSRATTGGGSTEKG